jgi:catechol 2,3-dioxygenase-like lactoylglutathione lyase family enzyme
MVARGPVLLYSEVRVRDLARAVRFYSAFGLGTVAKGTTADGTALVWLRDPKSGHLLQLFRLSRRSKLYKPFRRRNGLDYQLMFTTVDARPLLRKLRKLGGTVIDSFEEGGVSLTTLRDPDGTWLELLSWPSTNRRQGSVPPQFRLLRLRGPTR